MAGASSEGAALAWSRSSSIAAFIASVSESSTPNLAALARTCSTSWLASRCVACSLGEACR